MCLKLYLLIAEALWANLFNLNWAIEPSKAYPDGFDMDNALIYADGVLLDKVEGVFQLFVYTALTMNCKVQSTIAVCIVNIIRCWKVPLQCTSAGRNKVQYSQHVDST
jgi:hypothetical protein